MSTMTATTPAVTTAQAVDTTFTAWDRCDREVVEQAVYRVAVPCVNEDGVPIVTTLQFCSHHANEHEAALIAMPNVCVIADNREQIISARSG